MKKPYILLDAGGTLVFPDVVWLSDLMKKYEINITTQDILKRVYEIDYLIDKSMKDRVTLLEDGNLLEALFKAFTNSDEKVKELKFKTDKRDKIKNLWAYTFPCVVQTIEKLKKDGYSISVISNSDGRAAQVLESVGLSKFMDKIYDSQTVGIAKPDAGIFKLALKELSLSPEDTVFIGDMFYTDILGSNRAGIPAVHLDPFDFYKDWPGMRVKNISAVPDLIENSDFRSKDFFPFVYDLKEV